MNTKFVVCFALLGLLAGTAVAAADDTDVIVSAADTPAGTPAVILDKTPVIYYSTAVKASPSPASKRCDGTSKDPVFRQQCVNTFLLRIMSAAADNGDKASIKAAEKCGKCEAGSKAQQSCINTWVIGQQFLNKEGFFKSCLLVWPKDKQACVNAWAFKVNAGMAQGAGYSG